MPLLAVPVLVEGSLIKKVCTTGLWLLRALLGLGVWVAPRGRQMLAESLVWPREELGHRDTCRMEHKSDTLWGELKSKKSLKSSRKRRWDSSRWGWKDLWMKVG